MVTGATVTVQFVPLLFNTILVLGTMVGLEELAVTVRPAPEVPGWPTVNVKGPQVLLAVMV